MTKGEKLEAFDYKRVKDTLKDYLNLNRQFVVTCKISNGNMEKHIIASVSAVTSIFIKKLTY